MIIGLFTLLLIQGGPDNEPDDGNEETTLYTLITVNGDGSQLEEHTLPATEHASGDIVICDDGSRIFLAFPDDNQIFRLEERDVSTIDLSLRGKFVRSLSKEYKRRWNPRLF